MNLLGLSIVATTLLVLCTPAVTAEGISVKSPPSGCRQGGVKTPESNVEKPSDAGERAHTNIEIVVPCPPLPQARPDPEGTGRTLAPEAPSPH